MDHRDDTHQVLINLTCWNIRGAEFSVRDVRRNMPTVLNNKQVYYALNGLVKIKKAKVRKRKFILSDSEMVRLVMLGKVEKFKP